ncbi:MAG: spore cortex biosynthesis protein YabQ [Ruminococcus sp.]|nr:spore cortex biosynthesis protein YabQ [Ruminococcus sp.]
MDGLELTFEQQTVAFMWSFALGAGLGVFYGALKFLRFTFSLGRATVIAVDIFFMLVWSMSVFFFSLGYLMGFIRAYVFAGSFIGFLLYRLTAGRLLCKLYSPLIRFIKELLQKTCEKSKLIAKYLLKIARKVLYNINRKSESLKSDHEIKRKSHEVNKAKNKKSR